MPSLLPITRRFWPSAGRVGKPASGCGPRGGSGCGSNVASDALGMPLRLEITLPPQIALDLDPRKVRAVLRSAGSEIAALARRKVRQTVGSGKTYYGAGKGPHRASLPGQPPASWTGQLAGRVETRVFSRRRRRADPRYSLLCSVPRNRR
jgi:hypothetical protein